METTNQDSTLQLVFNIDEREPRAGDLDKRQIGLVAALMGKWLQTNKEVTSLEEEEDESA